MRAAMTVLGIAVAAAVAATIWLAVTVRVEIEADLNEVDEHNAQVRGW